MYDLGLMIFAVPIGLYVAGKAAPYVRESIDPIHPILSAGAYLYLMLMVIWCYRILFGYTKWAFPTVELTNNSDSSTAHRVIWGAIILAIITNLVWETLKVVPANL